MWIATTSSGLPSATIGPFSSSIALLQYSVTQSMSWVTRTIAFASLTSSRTRAFDFSRNAASPGREDLVEEQDVRLDRRRDREPEPGPHARRVRLDRRVDELAEIGELDDAGQPLLDDRVLEAHERAGQADVVAAGELLVEAGAEGQQARDVAVDLDRRPPTA